MLARFADLAAECDNASRNPEARRSLLELASSCRVIYPDVTEEALLLLSRHDVPLVQLEAASELGLLLVSLDGLSRLRVTTEWVTDGDDHQRLAIARALGAQMPVLGATAILDRLAHDGDPDVRRAACEACGHRINGIDAGLVELLETCARDDHHSVRHAAIAALEGIAANDERFGRATSLLHHAPRTRRGDLADQAHGALRKLRG